MESRDDPVCRAPLHRKQVGDRAAVLSRPDLAFLIRVEQLHLEPYLVAGALYAPPNDRSRTRRFTRHGDGAEPRELRRDLIRKRDGQVIGVVATAEGLEWQHRDNARFRGSAGGPAPEQPRPGTNGGHHHGDRRAPHERASHGWVERGTPPT